MPVGPYSAETVWFADSSDIIVRQFEDVYLAFSKKSGETHLLNFLTAAIVKAVINEAGSFTVLYERVLSDLQLDTDDCPFELMQSSILQLDDVGLLMPVQAGDV